MAEILDYQEQYGELPFRYEGDNWLYDAMCERQKRRGVDLSQYLTPDRTARQMVALAVRYFENDGRIVDVCCGTGQLTCGLLAEGVSASTIVAFDADCEMADLYQRIYKIKTGLITNYCFHIDFLNFIKLGMLMNSVG